VVAEHLSKTYHLGEHLRIEAMVRRLMRRQERDRFEALNDVSFDAYPGECLGIVGSNGSGKSTILQVLAGITAPTRGMIASRGTIMPLLAVGATFHGELTGRENSVLFGTILGLARRTILSRLDDIARFAEIERHFETPVKRYSHGMVSRLCFAIAMLFPADIYCFDEVLAVVDGEFRERCLAEIRSLADGGATVLVVSHDLEQVAAVANRVMWLDQGRLQMLGAAEEVLSRYEAHLHAVSP
jgi:ABC-type polysaccharide/polyol phosphate transport system ATPase subunit